MTIDYALLVFLKHFYNHKLNKLLRLKSIVCLLCPFTISNLYAIHFNKN